MKGNKLAALNPELFMEGHMDIMLILELLVLEDDRVSPPAVYGGTHKWRADPRAAGLESWTEMQKLDLKGNIF